MDIVFRSRRTNIPERFRQHAEGKLAKIGKLDHKAIRIDVEVTQERNPRQAKGRERVELTIRSRGPVVRAEAAADDRYTALDLAFAKLENRLRRSGDRRKDARHTDRELVRTGSVAAGGAAPEAVPESLPPDVAPPYPGHRSGPDAQTGAAPAAARNGHRLADGPDGAETAAAHLVPIQMEGDCPVVVREKLHHADPMTIDQALLEMELVGHDFYLFHDRESDQFSVVYRRRGYDYGVIRLMEDSA
ncbi:MAG: ribosome-associated translation inhibitor RaiA [Actinobacteria bacterium]|nr:ribosome-associated translation inhibitor RaiA [Actinomycetota bacterium]